MTAGLCKHDGPKQTCRELRLSEGALLDLISVLCLCKHDTKKIARPAENCVFLRYPPRFDFRSVQWVSPDEAEWLKIEAFLGLEFGPVPLGLIDQTHDEDEQCKDC